MDELDFFAELPNDLLRTIAKMHLKDSIAREPDWRLQLITSKILEMCCGDVEHIQFEIPEYDIIVDHIEHRSLIVIFFSKARTHTIIVERGNVERSEFDNGVRKDVLVERPYCKFFTYLTDFLQAIHTTIRNITHELRFKTGVICDGNKRRLSVLDEHLDLSIRNISYGEQSIVLKKDSHMQSQILFVCCSMLRKMKYLRFTTDDVDIIKRSFDTDFIHSSKYHEMNFIKDLYRIRVLHLKFGVFVFIVKFTYHRAPVNYRFVCDTVNGIHTPIPQDDLEPYFTKFVREWNLKPVGVGDLKRYIRMKC